MREKTIKTLAAALLILTLTACAGGRIKPEEDLTTVAPESTAETEELASIPEGYEFRVIRAGSGARESLSRAVRLRDMTVAERTGISVVYDDAADDAAVLIAATADFLSGEGCYRAAEGSFSRLCAPLFLKGALSAAEEFGGALGEASLNPSLVTKNGTYFITGAIVPASLGDVSCIAVNLDVASRFSVRVLDEKTLAGAGGWDALTASAATVPSGVGIYRYGVTDRAVGTSFLRSTGNSATVSGKNGEPSVAPSLAGGASAALRRAASLFGDDAVSFRPTDQMPREERKTATEGAFSDPGILYLFCETKDLPTLRDAGNEILILPYPGDAAGADGTNGTAGVILKGGGAPVAAALSALEEASARYVFPETVDACLSGRARYDTDSRDALVRILSVARYETALTLAGEGGAELSDALTAAATGDADALVGWELKAALLSPLLEKIFASSP